MTQIANTPCPKGEPLTPRDGFGGIDIHSFLYDRLEDIDKLMRDTDDGSQLGHPLWVVSIDFDHAFSFEVKDAALKRPIRIENQLRNKIERKMDIPDHWRVTLELDHTMLRSGDENFSGLRRMRTPWKRQIIKMFRNYIGIQKKLARMRQRWGIEGNII